VLQNKSALKRKIDQLWDKFLSGGISNQLAGIEQIASLRQAQRPRSVTFSNAGTTKNIAFKSRFAGAGSYGLEDGEKGAWAFGEDGVCMLTTRIPKGWKEKKIKDVAPLQRGFDLPNSHLENKKHKK
jgi:hypothetical protein